MVRTEKTLHLNGVCQVVYLKACEEDRMEGTILVVDDNLFYGQLIAYTLSRRTSYRIQCIQTGFQALTVVKNIIPILFLLNYQLPDMTGIALYDQLHIMEGRTLIPALLLSADLPDQKLEEQLVARKIIGISKPCHMDHLLTTINTLVVKHSREPVRN